MRLAAALVWTLILGSTCSWARPQEAPATPAGAQGPITAVAPLPDSSLDALRGARVRAIEFRGAPAQELDELRELIELQPNQPLDKQKLRRSIQQVYATGRFADVRVEAERSAPQEVTLFFIAQPNYFIGPVTLAGAPKGGPTESQLINASKLLLGEIFTAEKMQSGFEAMKRSLQQNGYYQAQIAADYTRHPETQQIDVHFRVSAGEQARVGKIMVQGDAGYAPEEIADIGKIHPGDEASSSRLERALRRIRGRYQKQDRLEAEVALAERIYHGDSNTLDFVFRIERGPTVDIHVEGARIRKGLLKKYVPVYEENAVDDDLLNEGRRNLRDYFQTKGYFDVQVGFKQTRPEADHRHIIYDVDLGERHKLAEVAIVGSQYFPEDTIRERMIIQEAGRLLSHGLFSDSRLNRDLDAIRDLYRGNGFQQAKVEADVQDNVGGEHGRMKVTIHIEEGPQTRVAQFRMDGVSAFDPSELEINTAEGQPFAESTIVQDRELILNHYFNLGFPEARMEYSFQPVEGDPTRMQVTYTITEGRQVFVDRVLTTGLRYTRGFVAKREYEIRKGEPLSQSEMYDTQRNLYDLGIFNQVDVAVQNPEGKEKGKTLLIDVDEARRWTFHYGLGVEVQTGNDPNADTPQGRTGASPRVSFEMNRINFRGRDHTVVFKGHVGRLQQRGLFSYEAPRWFDNRDLTFTFTAFYDLTRDVRTFTAERLEGSLQAKEERSKATTLLYRFTYRRVKATDLKVSSFLTPLYARPVRVGMPSFTYINDRRDDPLDSHKGIYSAADLGVASSIFGSQAGFGRLLLTNSSYHPLGKRKQYVLARSVRLGVEVPYGDYNRQARTQDRIPLAERFFSGGGNSHRGFAINQAGPRDVATGFPVGGTAMFFSNVELRLPPVTIPFIEDNISVALFHDMGNVFTTAGEMFRSFARHTQRNPQACNAFGDPAVFRTCDLDYFSHAIGGGLRYRTPIGPVRLDFGYNLNPPLFPVRDDLRAERLRRFNFYFSIGQTF